ncbi:hypothetical protein C8R44DRAFT_749558 [Mycena epipterygia]|nr:hypothetical protein C8R44DRAFT_749558 [Mycena epipterygia]
MRSFLAIILCFISFLLGQLFNGWCTSLAAGVKIESFSPQVHAVPGFSFKTLFFVVLSVLAIHDIVVFLLLRHLLLAPKPAPKGTLKARAITADGYNIPQSTNNASSVHMDPSSSTGSSDSRGYRWPIILARRRDFSLFILDTALPLLSYCAVLFRGLRLHPFRYLAAAVKIDSEYVEKREDALVGDVVPYSANVEGKNIDVSAVDVTPEPQADRSSARLSHFPLLRNLAAAAILRKCRVRIVVEEACHATIEEISEEVQDSSITLLEDASNSSSVEPEEKIDEISVNISVPGFVKKVAIMESVVIEVVSIDEEPAPTYCEFELDTAPSYEEFAEGVPVEVLFEKMQVVADHGSCFFIALMFTCLICISAIIHLLPSLCTIATRTGTKSTSPRPRVSQLHLLTRLSTWSGNSTIPAEPVAA